MRFGPNLFCEIFLLYLWSFELSENSIEWVVSEIQNVNFKTKVTKAKIKFHITIFLIKSLKTRRFRNFFLGSLLVEWIITYTSCSYFLWIFSCWWRIIIFIYEKNKSAINIQFDTSKIFTSFLSKDRLEGGVSRDFFTLCYLNSISTLF